ncbi:MAG TPA: sugar ABC transporter substrate-binding protein [Methylomirabilota bacterium]|nr:sugar ABC transporter substrate-binding protein [Methylomirabilota bacterium]
MIRWLVGSVLTIAIGAGLAGVEAAAADVTWRRFEGQTVRFLGETIPASPFLREKILPDFTAKTGIKVVYEDYIHRQLRQKMAVEMAAKSPNLDVYMTLPMVVGREYWKSGFIEPLDRFLKDPSLTASDYDYDDLSPAVRAICARYFEGKTGCVAFSPQTQILYWRKDVFARAGLQGPPQTLAEMEAAAARIMELPDGPEGKVYGIILRGAGYDAVTQLSYYLYTFGGTWQDDKGRCHLTSAEAIQALDFYGRMLRKYGPPGAVKTTDVETQSLYAQGKTAMYTDIATRAAVFEDPARSKVAGKLGYARIPAGPSGKRQMMLPINGLFISAFSARKDAAWLLIQYLTSKEVTLALHLRGSASPRVSTWDSPEYKKQEKHPDWTDATLFGIRTGLPLNVPDVIAANEARTIIGQAIQASILGQDVRRAAQQACEEWNALLRKTGDLKD